MIHVTEEDIRLGKPKCHVGCAIALAVKRAFAGSEYLISVGLCRISIGDSNHRMPPEAVNFRQRFDAGLPVEPLSFNL